MQKLSQTEELARSLAAKAHRHTLTTEQISRTMEEADFDIAQLDELYAALEQRGVHLAEEEPAELPVLDDAQIGRLENELSSEGVALDDPVTIPWKTYLLSASPYHPVPDDSSISRHEVPGLLCTKRYPKNGSSSVPNGCTTHDTHPNQTNHARATDAETSARPPHSSKPRRNFPPNWS